MNHDWHEQPKFDDWHRFKCAGCGAAFKVSGMELAQNPNAIEETKAALEKRFICAPGGAMVRGVG